MRRTISFLPFVALVVLSTLSCDKEKDELREGTGMYQGHEYVDLGLSVKWATCNVGASKPGEYGDYFAWGETELKKEYNWSTYKYCNGSYKTQTKYNSNINYGTVDNKTTLDPEDDAAHVIWGGNWRMPTQAECDELCNKDNCTWIETSVDGGHGYMINGLLVISRKAGYEGNSIFLPAAGYSKDFYLSAVGSWGYYWSSSLYTNNSSRALSLWFYSGYGTEDHDRHFGYTIRPVCP